MSANLNAHIQSASPFRKKKLVGRQVENETLECLRKIALFRGLSQPEMEWVSRRVYRTTFSAGATIITADQPGEAVYFILTGTLKVYLTDTDGSEIVLAVSGPGDILGEMSIIDEQERSASVVVVEETDAFWMDRRTFWDFLHRAPAAKDNLARLLSLKIRSNSTQIQNLARMNVYGRVARQLLAFGVRYGVEQPDGDIEIRLRLTQSDLADLVGASRKRVNQVMVQFKKKGVLSVSANYRITIHDLHTLEVVVR